MVAAPVFSDRDHRLHALDGLRGAAAVVVFFHHVVVYVAPPAWLDFAIAWTPLGLLFNGPGAVHVFFVLSGYVLALTLEKDTSTGRLPRYYVRRWFRIHPPYVVAVLIAWIAGIAFAGMWSDPRTSIPNAPASFLPSALAFPGRAYGLLPVGWSLFVELALSMLFPLLFVLGRVHPLLPIAVALPFLIEIDPRLRFLRFGLDFAIGLGVRLGAEPIRRGIALLPPNAPVVLVLFGLACLQAPMLDSLVTVGQAGLDHGHSARAVAIFAFAAGALLVGTLHAPAAQRLLSTTLARFFGRISYSFYLLHHTLLLVCILLVQRIDSSATAMLAAVGIAFVASVVSGMLGWRFVEAPSIRAGRALIRIARARFGA